MPEPENEPERELGPRISEALQAKADTTRTIPGESLSREAHRRVRKRRQTLIAGSAAIAVAIAIGGVWTAGGGPSTVATSNGDSAAGNAEDGPTAPTGKAATAPPALDRCPAKHPISTAPSHEALPAGTGLAPNTSVTGLWACRYRLKTPRQTSPPEPALLGSAKFDAARAQAVVDAIARLPERNPDLPGFKCVPEVASPQEAIVLRFGTAVGIREIWVGYDGCSSAGFFTGQRTYGLFAAPMRLFMVGSVRPAGGTYLDHLSGW